jgi:glycosyltransferase involved in cell wall biosynthesis
MKIVLATPLLPPEIGGPATYTVELAKRLESKHELVIVAYADNPESVVAQKLLVISKKQPLPVRLVKFFFALNKVAKGADVIYAQNAVAAGLPAMFVGKLRGVRVVVKFVGDEAWERATAAHKTIKNLEDFLKHPEGGLKTKMFMLLQGFVMRHVAAVTTPSRYLRDELISAYHLDPARVFTNYNAAEFQGATHTERKAHQVITVGRLVAWKGIDGIIHALKVVREKMPDATLVVAGEGPERERLEGLVRKQGAGNYVTFLGPLSHKDVLKALAQSEVFVLNSTYEGLPHSVLDAFATNTPVVASDISGTREVVENDKTGLLVKSGDEKALAEAIERCLTDKSVRRRVVDGGAAMLKEKFSWDAHITILDSIVSNRT